MAEFNFAKTQFEGLLLIDLISAGDNRGSFTKIFEKDRYFEDDISFAVSESFVSVSSKDVIRGLHFQTRDPQTKLVSVVKGSVWDVVVDLRANSCTFGQWIAFELNEYNHKALLIPAGFAHGFLALENETVMLYQCEGTYDKETDTGIIYNDPVLDIKWPIDDMMRTIVSERDKSLMSFLEFKKLYKYI